MNRKTFAKRYISLLKKLEAAYYQAVAEAINAQYKPVIAALKDRGVIQARAVNSVLVYNMDMNKVLTRMLKAAILQLGRFQLKKLLRDVKKAELRELGVIKAADSGAFGLDENWLKSIIDYLNQFILNRAVMPITDETKKLILQVLNTGQAEGWSIDRMLQELTNQTQELTPYRARRIIRTELQIGSNFANKLVQNSIPFSVDKEWISSQDGRVRDSHRKMDGVTVDENFSFQVPIIKKRVQVGIDLMSGPGDPEASAGNIINCRCVLAFIPKRDKKGKLIPAPIKQMTA